MANEDAKTPEAAAAADGPTKEKPARKPKRAAPGGEAPAGAEAAGGGGSKPAAEGRAPEAKKPAPPKRAPQAAGAGPTKKERGRSARKPSKRYRKALEMRPENALPLKEAVETLKKLAAGVKFDQTVNIAMFLGIDPKQAEQALRGAVSLPKGIGKPRKVICFAEGEDADKARAAGAVEVGSDELIAKISGGWQEFDVAVAHPRLMGKVGKLGRILGPSGKMPSPKNGTVTPDVATAVTEFAAGKVEYRNDTSGNIHAIVGKIGFPADDLITNIDAFIEHIRRIKPASSKGTYLKKVCISATMTPSVEISVGA
jgi:large subunit ribosomal protein L1